MNHWIFALAMLAPLGMVAETRPKVDLVRVDKSEARLYLIGADTVVADFPVAFGANPEGHKQQEGDERTPEGQYVLNYKKADSAFYRAIHISYPNDEDQQRAAKRGVSPGGQIMIHGQRNGFGWLSSITQLLNWTDGCIALTNDNMDSVWSAVEVGTPILIEP